MTNVNRVTASRTANTQSTRRTTYAPIYLPFPFCRPLMLALENGGRPGGGLLRHSVCRYWADASTATWA